LEKKNCINGTQGFVIDEELIPGDAPADILNDFFQKIIKQKLLMIKI
jgi:hypothetical protein